MDYVKLAGENLLFGFVIITIGFVLGYILYNILILHKISLKDSLFGKDNLAAWVEFIGAFVFPTLFLASKAIEGAANTNIWLDLLICSAYAATYVLALTLLRLISGAIVSSLGKSDDQGKINLNNEIYGQSNIAAALFSVSLSIIFASVIRFLDLAQGYILTSVFKMLIVAVFSLVAFAAYCLVLRRRSTLFKEIFIDNHPAAGISLAGFIFAVQIILSNAVTLQVEFNLADLLVTSGIWLVLLGFLSWIFTSLLTRLLKANIWEEIYEQDNIGAAIGQCALFIGIANVLVNFLK